MFIAQASYLFKQANNSFKRLILSFEQVIYLGQASYLCCLNKISNLFERHNKSFKRVILLLKQDN